MPDKAQIYAQMADDTAQKMTRGLSGLGHFSGHFLTVV